MELISCRAFHDCSNSFRLTFHAFAGGINIFRCFFSVKMNFSISQRRAPLCVYDIVSVGDSENSIILAAFQVQAISLIMQSPI